jgi:hypothetical protein
LLCEGLLHTTCSVPRWQERLLLLLLLLLLLRTWELVTRLLLVAHPLG